MHDYPYRNMVPVVPVIFFLVFQFSYAEEGGLQISENATKDIFSCIEELKHVCTLNNNSIEEIEMRTNLLIFLYADSVSDQQRAIKRIEDSNRTDILCSGLVLKNYPLKTQNITESKIITILHILQKTKDKRALPYCFEYYQSFHDQLLTGSANVMERTILLKNLLWTMRVLCDMESEIRFTFNDLTAVTIDKDQTIKAAEKYLRANQAYAAGYSNKGKEFEVSSPIK